MGSLRRKERHLTILSPNESEEDKARRFLSDIRLDGPPPAPTQRLAGEQSIIEEPKYVPVPKENEQYADRLREQGFLL